MKNTFRYDIDFVVGLDLPNVRRYKAAQGYNIDCPFCNKIRKMNINTAKNVYSCQRCSSSGGILTLHKNLLGFATNAEAKKDLEKKYSALSKEERTNIHQAVVQSAAPEYKNPHAAEIEERNLVYTAWLSVLHLNPEHLDELQSERRGWLPDDVIARLGYKSYSDGTITLPDGTDITFPEYALAKGGKMTYSSVKEKIRFYRVWFERKYSTIPGFIWNKKRGIVSYRERGCLLIPVRWRHGEISFLQQKYPALRENATPKERQKYKKYGRYGSYGDSGCDTSGLECVHYAGFDYQSDRTPENVWLTEGVLKADIAAYLSGKAFISLVGVNAHSQLTDELCYLKEHGTKRICVAVDMDYREKGAVMQALIKICEKIIASGLECQILSWNETYKGVDDFFIALKKGVPDLHITNRELLKIEEK